MTNSSVLLLQLALVACAQPTYQEPQQFWINSGLNSDQAQGQFNIDNGECTSKAVNSVRQPTPVPYPPIEGPADNPNIGPVQGYQRGRIDAYNEEQQRLFFQNRQSIYQGCMSSRGWQRQR